MTTLEDLVEQVKNGWMIGSCVECIYGTSRSGQRFAILITKVLWYAYRLIMEEEYAKYKLSPTGFLQHNEEWIIREESYTYNGIKEKANEIKSMLEKGLFQAIYKKLSTARAKPKVRDAPEQCASNPDLYLKTGDIIRTDFWFNSSHEGIYIGHGNVIHVSGHGGGKGASEVRVGRLLGDFVKNPEDTIRIVCYRIRIRTREQIVKCAQDWADEHSRQGEYNLLLKNCQHFARLCAIGREECGDSKDLVSVLLNILVAGAFVALAILR